MKLYDGDKNIINVIFTTTNKYTILTMKTNILNIYFVFHKIRRKYFTLAFKVVIPNKNIYKNNFSIK